MALMAAQNIVPNLSRADPMAERLNSDIGGLPADTVPRDEIPQLFWEKHLIATFNVLRAKGVFNLDELRRIVEAAPPEEYKRSSFYGRRIDGIAELLIEKKVINRGELTARTEDVLLKGTRDHVA
jgi:hypothetical protein